MSVVELKICNAIATKMYVCAVVNVSFLFDWRSSANNCQYPYLGEQQYFMVVFHRPNL
jgi:hypothetical protein